MIEVEMNNLLAIICQGVDGRHRIIMRMIMRGSPGANDLLFAKLCHFSSSNERVSSCIEAPWELLALRVN